MKKLLKGMSLLLALGMAFGYAACGGGGTTIGGGNGGGDDDEFGSGDGKTTVRFYSFNDSQTNKELNEALEADFYVKNPNIKVQTEISTGSFYTNLLNDFAGKVEADVFGMEPGEIYPFLSANYLEPLDDYFAASETVALDDIWDINKEAYAYDKATKQFGSGKTYAVLKDWTTDTMLFYNRAMFSAEQLAVIEKDENKDGIADPLTFDEFKKLHEGLLKRSGSTISQYSFLPGVAEAKALAQFITNAGLSWFDPANGYKSTFAKAETKEVVKFVYDILGANEVNNVGGTHMPLFAQGKVAMVFGGLYCIEAYGLDNLDLGVAYPPVKDDTIECKPYTTGCVGFAISSRSKVKEAAFKFVEWYLNYYGKINAEECNNFPAIEKYAEEIMLNPEINTNAIRLKSTKIFHESLKKAVIIDRNPYCSQASLETVSHTYTGEYLEGQMTLKEYCETIDYEVNKRVKQAMQAQG